MINLGRLRPFLRLSLKQPHRYRFSEKQDPNKDALTERKEEVQLM